jgi:hypothetical protein
MSSIDKGYYIWRRALNLINFCYFLTSLQSYEAANYKLS